MGRVHTHSKISAFEYEAVMHKIWFECSGFSISWQVFLEAKLLEAQ